MKTIENITSSDIEEFISQTHKGSCSFCGANTEPSIFTESSTTKKLVFTELKAFDAYGNINPFNASTPVIPVACPTCGNLSYLTLFHILKYLNKEDEPR